MDIKLLYIKSQKTVLNWGLGVAGFFFILTVTSFVLKGSSHSISFWISSLVYAAIFASMIINRLKINKKVAFAAFGLLALFSLYSLIESIIKFKTLNTTMNQTSYASTSSLIIGYAIGSLILLATNVLFYRVYKATQNILKINLANIKD